MKKFLEVLKKILKVLGITFLALVVMAVIAAAVFFIKEGKKKEAAQKQGPAAVMKVEKATTTNQAQPEPLAPNK